MPGPGGGSRGGGFGGGGFGGGRPGGFGGGGFGHRPYHRPHYHYHSPFFFRRPYGYGYGYGGGCLGGLLGILMMPIIILIIAASLILSVFGSFFRVAQGGQISYDEPELQKFANAQYAKEFNDSSAYEDNILIVFLVNEEYDGYYTIAWVGDNITTDINHMFGNQYTEFGYEMLANVPEYYEYSLSQNLASVTRGMADRIEAISKDSFIEKTDHSNMTASHLTNLSSIQLNNNTVNSALTEFTERTDIPIVIVVEDVDEVFDKTISVGDVIVLIIAVGIGAYAVYMIVKAIKNRKNGTDGENGESEEERKNNSTYW